MFDLEEQIEAWRRELRETGLGREEVLNELESHLRDDLERERRSGSDGKNAFEAAVLRLGHGEILKDEFNKVSGARAVSKRVKNAVFALAGIPNQYLPMNASEPNIEPWWATYSKAAAFLLPAGSLWMLLAVYVLPELHSIWTKSGAAIPGFFGNLNQLNFTISSLLWNHFLAVVGAAVVSLGLLEWLAKGWARYRRAVLGGGILLLNSLALISLFCMIVAATVAAAQFASHAK